mmetsp:Transcript_31016/g.101118  ORF Transcript_31016/g.101118 Transcript_31016/m.101118 type:complete len:241 (+) Transcript_31016:1818-2540(+)
MTGGSCSFARERTTSFTSGCALAPACTRTRRCSTWSSTRRRDCGRSASRALSSRRGLLRSGTSSTSRPRRRCRTERRSLKRWRSSSRRISCCSGRQPLRTSFRTACRSVSSSSRRREWRCGSSPATSRTPPSTSRKRARCSARTWRFMSSTWTPSPTLWGIRAGTTSSRRRSPTSEHASRESRALSPRPRKPPPSSSTAAHSRTPSTRSCVTSSSTLGASVKLWCAAACRRCKKRSSPLW